MQKIISLIKNDIMQINVEKKNKKSSFAIITYILIV